MPWIILILLSCNGCSACIGDLPTDDGDNESQDTAADTGEQDTAADTGPAPPCAQPEVEPNSPLASAQELQLEQWACGDLLTENDQDIFRFTTTTTGWVKLWVRGADLGTSSNLQLTLQDASYDYSTLVTSSPDSADPILVFPSDGNHTFYTTISDQYGGSGEDYFWEFLASEVKEPVSWDVEEIEPNNGIQDGLLVEAGDRIFGIIEAASDADWFLVEVPAPEDDEKINIVARVYAWNYGSPLDGHLYLYDPDESYSTGANIGEDSYDKDPILEKTATAGGTWGIKLAPHDGIGGGEAYWYVLEIDVETEDTGQ